MALPIVISASAKADLVDLWAYVADGDAAAPDRVLDRVFEVANKLAEWPEMGRTRDELVAGLRSFVVGSHVVFYRTRAGKLEIVRVQHGRRDVDALF